MNEQKRHLTIASIIVMLALAVLCYAGQAVGTRPNVADSHYRHGHGDSHEGRAVARTNRAAGVEVARDGAAFNTRGEFAGQLG